MPRNLPAALARRVYPRLPEPVRRLAKDYATTRSYAVNTAGLQPSAEALVWARQNRRPVSIVIPSYNDIPFLTECLRSIEETCADFDYEVIVVDDYCQPGNTERLRALEGGRVRLVLKERRQGFAVTVNVGMAQARHDIVLLNSDIVAKPGWLEALQRAAYAVDERIGLVSPKLVYPDGRIQYGGTYYARVLAPQWFGHLFVGSPATRPVANVAGYNRSLSGACVYVRREAYAELGGLDEDYWLGFEDVDYGLQAWERDHRCYYEPAALLVHHESASRGYSQGVRELSSMRYFWRRWKHLFLDRTLAADPPVDLVLSQHASGLWPQYVRQQAEEISALGLAATVHEAREGAERDEILIAELRSRASLKIAADWGSAVTVWLASLSHGKPVYLLPAVESGAHPHDPDLQQRIVAQYRPEFDYIAPNRWTADQLRAETAWEVAARVVPCLAPAPLSDAPDGPVITVGLSAELRSAVSDACYERSVPVVHLSGPLTPALLDRIRADHPRILIDLTAYERSLEPLALLSLGAAFLGVHNDKTRYEVLDGYNCLLVAAGAADQLVRALDDLLEHPDVRAELRANGHESASRHHAAAAASLTRALRGIAQQPV